MVLFELLKLNEILINYFGFDQNLIVIKFSNGYCLEYFEFLKIIRPDAIMVLENNKDHCAALINEVVYDVSGFRERNLFTIADQDEMNFVYSFYKRFSDSDENNVKEIIKSTFKK